uniref:Galactose-3-O-sulfotransferase 4 n=1 Tax=Latimeria chalumnae TaxID=7897 RepID=H3A8T6_LATCH
THVLFLKTHKTAGSTILNILYRFGEARNLTFALPTRYQFGYPMLFHSRRVKQFNNAKKQQYHIMCNHMRFFSSRVKKVMAPDTFYFSILRNPVTMAESSYTYYKSVVPAFKKVNSLEEFIADPQKYYSFQERSNHYAKNLLWFDFGFDNNANFSQHYLMAAIRNIEDNFNLILLSEYFDESMILLKDALCWELDDVMSFKLNFRSNDTVEKLSLQARKKLAAWNYLDWQLYVYFNKTFWQKVEQYGKEKMKQDVQLLQRKRDELMKVCLQGSRPVEASQIEDQNIRPFQFGMAKILGYKLNTDLSPSLREKCLRMILPELQYKDLLDRKLFLESKTSRTGTPQNMKNAGAANTKAVDHHRENLGPRQVN